MAIEILGNGAPDGTSLGLSTSEKVGLYGVVKAQAATIADVTTLATNADITVTSVISPVLSDLIDKFNVLLDDLSDLGINASA